MHAPRIDPTLRQTGDPPLEQIEGGAERNFCLRLQCDASAAASSGDPAMARKRSIRARMSPGSPEDKLSSACSMKRSAISPTLRPPTAVIPEIDNRSPTSACAAFGLALAKAARRRGRYLAPGGRPFGRREPGGGCVIDCVGQIAGLRRRATKILA